MLEGLLSAEETRLPGEEPLENCGIGVTTEGDRIPAR